MDTRAPVRPLSGITERAPPVPPRRLRTPALLRRRKAARPNRLPQVPVRPSPPPPLPALCRVRSPTPLRGSLGPGSGSRRPRSPESLFGPPQGTTRRVGSFPFPLPGPRRGRGRGISVFPRLSSPTLWQAGGGVSTLPLPSRALGSPHVGSCAPGQGRPGAPEIPGLFIPHADLVGTLSASPDPSGFWPGPCVVGRGSQLPLRTPPLAGLCVSQSPSDSPPPAPSAAITIADPHFFWFFWSRHLLGIFSQQPPYGSLSPPTAVASRPVMGVSLRPFLAPL